MASDLVRQILRQVPTVIGNDQGTYHCILENFGLVSNKKKLDENIWSLCRYFRKGPTVSSARWCMRI